MPNMTATNVAGAAFNVLLQQRLQPDIGYVGYNSDHVGNITSTSTSTATATTPTATATSSSTTTTKTSYLSQRTPAHLPTPTTAASLASMILFHFLPSASSTSTADLTSTASTATQLTSSTMPLNNLPASTTHSPPSIANLVASSAEDLTNFRDVTFDIFDDDDLFGSPLAFDASENGLWNGRFVPPPPRPPFLVDEAVLSDGLTTCDLCSWAMPTKSTFIFEGTIEKASELGWPLTLIIVSILSALVGAIIMVTVVHCRRKKATNNRNETHVQWWSRNKRPANNNNNHLRRSNIYTSHPADSIRGLHQQPSLSATSSLTAITAMGGGIGGEVGSATSANTATAGNSTQQHQLHHHQQQQQQQRQEQQPSYQTHNHHQQHNYRLRPLAYAHAHDHAHHQHHHNLQYNQQHQLFRQHDYDDFEHEYDQPQQLHQRQHSSSLSLSSSSLASTPSLTFASSTMMQHQPQQHNQQQCLHDDAGIVAATAATSCHWPNTTMLLAS